MFFYWWPVILYTHVSNCFLLKGLQWHWDIQTVVDIHDKTAEYLYLKQVVLIQNVMDKQMFQTAWLQADRLIITSDHGDKRLKPVLHLLHLVLQGDPQVFGGFLDALLHLLRLRHQQIIQGGDLRLGVVTNLSKIRVQPCLHVLHVGWAAGLKVLKEVNDMSERKTEQF